MKSWKCTVCGYEHQDDTPPEKCPVCGADQSLFKALHDEDSTPTDAVVSTPEAETNEKKWKCTVCGYIYTGPEPPDKCPVCGADKSMFVELVESPTTPAPTGIDAGKSEVVADADTQWECTVCGYIHTGPEPPDKCPVCGADKSLFVKLDSKKDTDESTAEQTAAAPAQQPAADTEHRFFNRDNYAKISRSLAKLHAHPISVHIPNGVLPLAVLCMCLALLFDCEDLRLVSFYNFVFILLAMPAVLFTGYNDWQLRFGGNMTRVFSTKMVCGAIVTGLSFVVVVWQLFSPDILYATTGTKFVFILLHLLALAAGAVAGFYGGKLIVFPGEDRL